MKRYLPQIILDRWFHIVVAIKGFDGLLEVIGGILLLVVPIEKFHGLLAITTYELAQDHHAFIANTIARLDTHLTSGLALFGAIYLIVHGGIKLIIFYALWFEKYHFYPVAIGLLLISVFYQSYRIGLDHSWWLAAFTILDLAIAWLTYLEWKRHTAMPQLPKNA